ncbi:MAG: SIMPL domain-containing protein [Alcaligenaceae bacterium]|nr:SIMPL domain-containing protein [Alcaligenaceae bacterium]
MKLPHLAFVLSALFASQLSIAQTAVDVASVSKDDDRTIISLAADAYREVQQDRVILTLSKEARGEESKALADEVNKAINAVMESGKGNAKLELKSGAYNLWPQQEYDENGKRTGKTTYVVNGEVIVNSSDMLEATRFVEQVSDQMNLSNIAFAMTTELRRQIENDIRAEAIQAFQDKARAVSREFGFDNYDIKFVQLNDSSSVYAPVPRLNMVKAEMAQGAAFAGPDLAAGKERVTITVTGQIALY